MTKFVIYFLVGCACYLVGLGIFSLIKYIKNKRAFKKEIKDKEEIENNEKND